MNLEQDGTRKAMNLPPDDDAPSRGENGFGESREHALPGSTTAQTPEQGCLGCAIRDAVSGVFELNPVNDIPNLRQVKSTMDVRLERQRPLETHQTPNAKFTTHSAQTAFGKLDEQWTRDQSLLIEAKRNSVELGRNDPLPRSCAVKTETNEQELRGDCIPGRENATRLDQCPVHYGFPYYIDAYDPLSFYDLSGFEIYGDLSSLDSAPEPFYPGAAFLRLPAAFLPTKESAEKMPSFKSENSLGDVRILFPAQRICQVCGEQASGCHYGALTCGSCKVFFKRAAEGKQKYLCASRNDCTIDKLRRRNCPSCRLKRCFASGMSLGAQKLKRVAEQTKMERTQTTTAVKPVCPKPALRAQDSLLSILERIEPAVVNAGHDQAQPDSTVSLLTSLNELGERQLVTVVKWAKGVPGFQKLHIDDQMAIIQYSWMVIMVFGLGWRSFKNSNARLLYFAPDLVFNDQRMQVSSMYEHCIRMRRLSESLGRLKVTQEEFLCMKALLLFSIIPEDGLKSQSCFDELRTTYIKELDRLVAHTSLGDREERLFQLTQLLDYLHLIVKKLHQFTYDLFVQAQTLSLKISFPDMISDIISVHVPKILTGMARPILFHK